MLQRLSTHSFFLLLLVFIAATGSVSSNKEHNREPHLNFACALHKAWPGWWHAPQSNDDFIEKSFDITDPFSGKPAKIEYEKDKDPREEGFTKGDVVKSSTRNRALAVATNFYLSGLLGAKIDSLSLVAEYNHLQILDTMSYGPFAETIGSLKGRIACEFFPEGKVSGEIIKGPRGNLVRHENLMNTSFPDSTFDLVLSTEVFEHIPDPYQAHREIYRILKPGGAHVFTVPFTSQSKDMVMSVMDPNSGAITHVHPDAPQYHGDALRADGVIVFVLFGDEMLSKLCDIGYDVNVVNQYTNPAYGIYGYNSGLSFIAVKRKNHHLHVHQV